MKREYNPILTKGMVFSFPYAILSKAASYHLVPAFSVSVTPSAIKHFAQQNQGYKIP